MARPVELPRRPALLGRQETVGPHTDEQQAVHLDFPYPDAQQELSRSLPLVKWLLAIPHYVLLFFLTIGALFAAIGVWFAVLFTGRYPRALFDYIEGVIRWQNASGVTPSC